jgi:hypothetical protein
VATGTIAGAPLGAVLGVVAVGAEVTALGLGLADYINQKRVAEDQRRANAAMQAAFEDAYLETIEGAYADAIKAGLAEDIAAARQRAVAADRAIPGVARVDPVRQQRAEAALRQEVRT